MLGSEMEFTSQTTTPNHSLYLSSAPNSPSDCSMHFYSAPTSPIKATPNTNENVMNSNFDNFEFETSRNFCLDGFEFETSQRFEYPNPLLDNDQQQQQQQQQQHGVRDYSLPLPTMAFADELFRDGQVVPLKLPPRLQFANQNSTASSPRSPSSVLKIPFSWRSMWNDDFDPFMAALDKVKEEEKKGKSHHIHRRARSLSPFRSNDSSSGALLEVEPMMPHQRHQMVPMESKGSAYARWVRHHNNQLGTKKASQVSPSPKIQPKLKGSPPTCGKRVRNVKRGHEGPTKTEEIPEEDGRQKRKGFLLKYASFGREKNESKLRDQIAALWKPTYFKNFSFNFKRNANKKKVNEEPKMTLAQYRPRLRLCLGYGFESPGNMN
ncbi:hypothetical protein F0562_022651 [Nyssa sinensis]|uniref:Uncharacterized protein n=1 Tax=Nyssa sinensis TaxID=561372 RepID=A0A5J5BP61_9ASTE|nr:hypothetical protein F0562_022651 [Nyssa sinensis]